MPGLFVTVRKESNMLTPQEFVSLRRAILDRQFSRMNGPQRQAVFCTEGPLLILAGRAAGKPPC